MSLEIKEAVVAKFENKMKDGNIIHYIIAEDTIKNILCIYDDNQKMIFDINTGDKYYVLNRDKRGRIESSEEKRIQLNEPYALGLEPVNWLKYNRVQRMKIRLQSQKMLFNLRFRGSDSQSKINKWDEREAWKSNYNNLEKEDAKRGKVIKFNR